MRCRRCRAPAVIEVRRHNAAFCSGRATRWSRPATNTQLRYKEAMNSLEAASPGTKAQFFVGYVDKVAPRFRAEGVVELSPRERCGQPTTGHHCAFCRSRGQVLGEHLDPPSDGETTRELSEEVLPVEIYGGVRS